MILSGNRKLCSLQLAGENNLNADPRFNQLQSYLKNLSKDEYLGFSDCDLRLLIAKDIYLPKVKFVNVDLSYANLEGAVLEEMGMIEVRGEGVNLAGVSASKAKLAAIRMGGKFSGADFRESYLRKSVFRDAMLFRAIFKNARFEDVSFIESDLREADFRFDYGEKVHFNGCNERGAVFNVFPFSSRGQNTYKQSSE